MLALAGTEGPPPSTHGVRHIGSEGAPPRTHGVRHIGANGAPPRTHGVRHIGSEGAPPRTNGHRDSALPPAEHGTVSGAPKNLGSPPVVAVPE